MTEQISSNDFKAMIQSKFGSQAQKESKKSKKNKVLAFEKKEVQEMRANIQKWIMEYKLVRMTEVFSMKNPHYRVCSKYLESEELLHIFCYQFVNLYYSDTVKIWHTDNETNKNMVARCISKLMGLTNGVSDLIMQKKRVFAYPLLFVELKSKDGTAQESQKNFLEEQNAMGNHTHILNNFKDFIESFEDWFKNA